MNYDLKDISKVTKKENKQQQQQHGSHANSSSHTLTEAEMKEGVDYYTTMTSEGGTSSLIIINDKSLICRDHPEKNGRTYICNVFSPFK